MAKKPAPKKKGGKRSRRTGLTAQEEKFCQHFALNQVGAESVRHAFPDWKNKGAQDVARKASKLLARGEIKGRVAALREKVVEVATEKFEVTAQDVLEELAAIGFYKTEDYFEWGTQKRPLFHKDGSPVIDSNGEHAYELVPWMRAKDSKELSRQQMRAVLAASMTISKTGDPVLEVKMGDKVSALKAIGTHLGMFKQVVQAEGKGGGPIQLIVSSAENNL